MNHKITFYLTAAEHKKMKDKLKLLGYEGKRAMARFIIEVCDKKVIFLGGENVDITFNGGGK